MTVKKQVAIKTIKKAKIETEADLIRIRREIQIMSSVRHPNIIHIYEVFENKEKMVLVMEYAAGGELYDYLSQRKVLAEAEARRVFRQVASAVYYCHKVTLTACDLNTFRSKEWTTIELNRPCGTITRMISSDVKDHLSSCPVFFFIFRFIVCLLFSFFFSNFTRYCSTTSATVT